jgi:prepilin-type N-terminal cleavage/methylation domain-containing protein
VDAITRSGEAVLPRSADNEHCQLHARETRGSLLPSKVLKRLKSEQGFTMIELLIVMILFVILVTIALPAYLTFRERANDSSAKTAIRNISPALIEYNGDHKSGYTGVTPAKLKASYNFDVKKVSIFLPTTTTYCLKSRVGVRVWYKGGPSGVVSTSKPTGICP